MPTGNGRFGVMAAVTPRTRQCGFETLYPAGSVVGAATTPSRWDVICKWGTARWKKSENDSINFKKVLIMIQYSNLDRVIDTRDHFKNGIGLKNVNHWNGQNQTYKSIRTLKNIGKTDKRAMESTVDKVSSTTENNLRYFSLQWHITDDCDQRCKHCYVYNAKNKCISHGKSLQDLILILDDYLASCHRMNKIAYPIITGGDPLLYPNIWEFLTEVSKRNCRFSIMGNPFHITVDVAAHLYDLGLETYQMSIDGIESTHDYLRRPGSFQATIKAMPILKDAGIRPTVKMTISKTNAEEIPKLIDWLVDNSVVATISFARYCPTHDDLDTMMTSIEYKDFLESIWVIYQKYRDSIRAPLLTFKDHLWKPFLLEKGLFEIEENNDIILDGCHCGISHLTCLSDGTIYACRSMESPVGRVPEQSIYDIFFSDRMEKYRAWDKFNKCKKCKLLNYCRGCPAVAYTTTGDFYAPDPQCWFDTTEK